MNWKDIYMKAFPQKAPPRPYDWPELQKPGPGDPSKYPQLGGPSKAPGGAYPELKKAGAGEGSAYPQVASGAGAGEYNWPEAKPQTKWPGMNLPSSHPVDHVGDFNFRVEIEGVDAGAFTKVEGLNVSIEPIEYQHSDDITPRKRMGKIRVDNVKLIKGYVNTPHLYKWCEDAMKGDISRKSLSIVLLADDGASEVCRYNLYDCWPCKWGSFRLDGQGRAALVEEIEIVVEHVERA
jgi:phage tail-like protein